MKKAVVLLLSIFLIFSLAGCAQTPAEPSAPTTPPTQTTAPPTTEPPTTQPPTTEPVETVPEHSDLYLQDVPVEDVIAWFSEVNFSREFGTEGDPTVIQKWETPISYSLLGEATPEDWAVVEELAAWLNTVEGFPGIYPAEESRFASLQIYFTDAQDMQIIMGPEFAYLDGGVTYWYEDNVIYDCHICVLYDLDPELRRSVLLEEIYNGLGPVQDTLLRPDSIAYQEFSQPQNLTVEDELILRLLYDPRITCGMNAEECEAVIKQIYY